MHDWEHRLERLSHSPRLRTRVFGRDRSDDFDCPLYALTFGDAALPAVYVAAGVHGDEPAGVEAALQLLKTIADGASPTTRVRLVVLPCLNPSGLSRQTRTNGAGQDINRQFHADTTEVTAAVRRVFVSDKVQAVVDLHSDLTADGFYFFELLQRDVTSLAGKIQGAMTGAGHTLESAPFYAGYLGEQGLINPNAVQMEEFERAAPGASLAQWAWGLGVPRSYVFETPLAAGREAGAAMHLVALSALLPALDTTVTEG